MVADDPPNSALSTMAEAKATKIKQKNLIFLWNWGNHVFTFAFTKNE